MDHLYHNLMNNFSVCPKEGLDHHIRQHLGYLLNTRQQSIAHLEDYGLPDVQQLLLELPGSTPRICQAVHDLISKYEPRLSSVTILPIVPDNDKTLLQLKLTALSQPFHTGQFMVRFQTDGFVVLT